MGFLWRLALLASCLAPSLVNAGGAPTDSYRDADEMQSSYLDNHNMDPNIVNSPVFGMLWSKTYRSGEKFFAKPLIFTSSKGLNGNKPVVILCSAMNNIYVEDGKNGGNQATIAQRNLAASFTQADADNCPDLGGPAGIIGTPVIDPATEIMYLFSKSYADTTGATQGTANGKYRFHAIDINSPTLADISGYPIMIDGSIADNDPGIHFFGGVQLQRPSLLYRGGVIYAGFGSHCDKFNFTGAIIGVNVASKQVVTYWSTEIRPWLQPGGLNDWTVSTGQGGIWMGGTGLSSDSGSRFFFSTGNGKGKQAQQGQSLDGKSVQIGTLGEAVVNLRIGSDGKVALQDWFQPYDYALFDNNDEDLGSAGVMLLDTGTFKGTGVSKMAVTYGKNAYMYVLNADNLGGFGNGPGGGDKVIQTINTGASTFGGSGSYPLDGGYIYFVPSTTPIQAYKLGFKADGTPQFSFAGASANAISGRIGPPTITSYRGQGGTGIVWVADNNAGLVAFKAVPENGVLVQLSTPPTGGLNKFQRPAFGDGTVYVTNSNGKVMCLGSPVNLPLNCSSIDFGDVTFGSTKAGTVTCQVATSLKVNYITVSDPKYSASNSSLPSSQLSAGSTFSFQVVWTAPSDAPGVTTGTVTINLTPAQANQFTNNVPVGLKGNVVSEGAFITISPVHYSFNPIIVGTPAEAEGQSGTFILGNAGLQLMKILGYYYSEDGTTYHNLTRNTTDSTYWVVGSGFNVEAASLPSIGSTLGPGVQTTVSMQFYDVRGQSATYGSALFVSTNGGIGRITMSGTASASPKAQVAISTTEGFWNTNWQETTDFSAVQAVSGSVAYRTMRVCNLGGSALAVTKSKPISTPYLYADIETAFPEGLQIAPGDCAYGNVTFTPGRAYINTAPITVNGSFVLNFNDQTWGGENFVNFQGTIMPKQVGPLDGLLALYQFAGCYKDSTCGANGISRCFSAAGATDTNNATTCIAKCQAKGLPIAATEYTRECWCGSVMPPRFAPSFVDAAGLQSKCNFPCPNDASPLEFCGGTGQLMNVYYDVTKITITSSSSSSTTTSTTTSVASSSTSSQTTTTGAGTTTTTTAVTTTASTTPTTTTIATTTTTTATTTTATARATGHVPGNANYTWIGCVSEPATGRAMTQQLGSQAAVMTVELCLEYCNGYAFIGLQYGQECWCTSNLTPNFGPTVDVSKCNKLCKGDSTEYCGASKIFDLYQRRSDIDQVSSSTTTTTTTTTSSSVVVVASSSTTTTTTTTTTPPPPPTTTAITTSTVAPTTPPTTTPTTTTTTVAPSSSQTTTIASTTTTTPPTTLVQVTTLFSTTMTPYSLGYYSLGCYLDQVSGFNVMTKLNANNSMNVESCLSLASSKSANYAGLEYGRECWTASVTTFPNLMTTSGKGACTIACMGNTTQSCGGRNMLNLYYSPPTPTPTPQKKKRSGKLYGDFGPN
ncbi:hypothetical protein ABW21_db0206237 [Orbilia brochopaga]|nr:hypothetical protein ABW21_db0206237 [Drechslerella brochopaga]